MEKKEEKDSDSIIYVLYYNKESKDKAIANYGHYDWARPIFNRTDKYLENNFYQRAMLLKDEWKNRRFVGCIAYRLPDKTHVNIDQVLRECVNSDIDVIAFFAPFPTFYSHAGACPPHCVEYLKKIVETTTDIVVNDHLSKRPFYCNYWACRPEILEKYIRFLDDVIEKIEMDPELSATMYNIYYHYPVKTLDTFLKIFGKPHYTWHPFIIERLLPLFCHHNNYKIKYCTQ